MYKHRHRWHYYGPPLGLSRRQCRDCLSCGRAERPGRFFYRVLAVGPVQVRPVRPYDDRELEERHGILSVGQVRPPNEHDPVYTTARMYATALVHQARAGIMERALRDICDFVPTGGGHAVCLKVARVALERQARFGTGADPRAMETDRCKTSPSGTTPT